MCLFESVARVSQPDSQYEPRGCGAHCHLWVSIVSFLWFPCSVRVPPVVFQSSVLCILSPPFLAVKAKSRRLHSHFACFTFIPLSAVVLFTSTTGTIHAPLYLRRSRTQKDLPFSMRLSTLWLNCHNFDACPVIIVPATSLVSLHQAFLHLIRSQCGRRSMTWSATYAEISLRRTLNRELYMLRNRKALISVRLALPKETASKD